MPLIDEKKSALRKFVKSDPRVERTSSPSKGALGRMMGLAKKVTTAVGGDALTDYAGSKMAKMVTLKANRKYVPDSTSGKAALKSAGSVAAFTVPLPFLPVAKGASMGVRGLRRIVGGKTAAKATNFGDSATPRTGYVKNAMTPAGKFTANKKIITKNSVRNNIKNIRFDK